MKKAIVISVALLVLVCNKSFAQSEYRPALQKGSVLIGGSMAINLGNAKYEYSSQTSKSKLNSFQFTPEVGFFAGNGFALGLSLDFKTESQKSDQDNSSFKMTSTDYLAGPFIRLYTKGGLFFMGNYSFGKSITKYTYSGDSESDENNVSKWKLGIGYATFLNDHVALEPSLSYQGYSFKEEENDSDFTYRTGQVVIGLGLSIYLGRKSDPPVAD
jgi:outer membrane protein